MAGIEKTIKIQKFLSQLGVASRRNCERLVEQGAVTVDGKLAYIAMRVSEDARVTVHGKPIVANKLPARIIMLNKPEGYECTRKPKLGLPSVFNLLPTIKGGQWVLVGRLDVNTSGLLLATNSGDIAHRLMHPKFHLQREYLVRVRGVISKKERFDAVNEGIMIDDKCIKFEKFDPITQKSDNAQNQWYSCAVMVGYYRIIRRVFESMGVSINRLKRCAFGPVSLPRGLQLGKFVDVDPAIFGE
jgi:23S rRNA pseudouridine2605 synthase